MTGGANRSGTSIWMLCKRLHIRLWGKNPKCSSFMVGQPPHNTALPWMEGNQNKTISSSNLHTIQMEFLQAQKIWSLFSPYAIPDFHPFSFNKWNLETSNHFLVTQDQNPSSSNHKSLVTVTVRHLECLQIFFFLLIRNSLDAVLKVSREPYSTLLSLAANTWHVIWPSIAFLKPGFKETDNSSIGW